jgi:hypothetical protein
MTDQLPAEPSQGDPDLMISTVWDEAEARAIRSKVGRPIRGKKLNKEAMEEDLQHAYLALGGVERLIHEGHQDYKWFANRFIKPGILLPDEQVSVDVNYAILPAIARSPLDGEYTDVSPSSPILPDDGVGGRSPPERPDPTDR